MRRRGFAFPHAAEYRRQQASEQYVPRINRKVDHVGALRGGSVCASCSWLAPNPCRLVALTVAERRQTSRGPRPVMQMWMGLTLALIADTVSGVIRESTLRGYLLEEALAWLPAAAPTNCSYPLTKTQPSWSLMATDSESAVGERHITSMC